MPKPDHAPGYVPNPDYSQEDWDEVCDNPELTDAEIAELRPAAEVLPPALYAALVNRGGRPKAEVRRVPISLRVDPNVLAAFKADGPGWQTRMNEALAAAVAETTKRRRPA